MKILQLIHKEQTRGAEIFTCQLSNHFQKLGHDVRIISIFSGEGELPYKGKIFCLNASPDKRFVDWKAWKTLASIIDDFQPHILQANSGDTLKYAVISKRLFRWECPIIVRNASEVGRYLKSKPQKFFNNFLYQNVEQVISVSHASEKNLLNQFPFLQGKTVVLPIGLEITSDGISSVELSPTGVKHIIHVGGFSFEKNHHGLLRIFSSLCSSKKDVHLHLLGDGPLKGEIEIEVLKLGLEEKISFYGNVKDPLKYIKEADVLVLPSLIEGLPGVLLEAMYCKTPVVAYNVGGISEILNTTTGHLVLESDEMNFVNNILEVLNKNNEYRIECAYKMVKENFSNTFLSLKFLDVYKSLIRSN